MLKLVLTHRLAADGVDMNAPDVVGRLTLLGTTAHALFIVSGNSMHQNCCFLSVVERQHAAHQSGIEWQN